MGIENDPVEALRYVVLLLRSDIRLERLDKDLILKAIFALDRTGLQLLANMDEEPTTP